MKTKAWKKIFKLIRLCTLIVCLCIPCIGAAFADNDSQSTGVVCPECGTSDYVTFVQNTQEATCMQEGKALYMCGNPDAHPTAAVQFGVAIPKLPHNYQVVSETEATCDTNGSIVYQCKNVDSSATAVVVCGDTYTETIPALGHDLITTVVQAVSCTEDGINDVSCSRCAYSYKDVFIHSGHQYPDEWTIEKEATKSEEGLESRKCIICGNAETRIIEKLPGEPIPAAVPIAGGIAALGLIAFAIKKSAAKATAKKLAEKIAEESAEKAVGLAEAEAAKEILKPTFADRALVTCIKNDGLYKLLKVQKHLSVTEAEYDKLVETSADEEPNLILADVSEKSMDEITALISKLKDASADSDIALLVGEVQGTETKDALGKMKAAGKISAYGPVGQSPYISFVKLVLPSLKPDLKSDDALGNIGMVADALGIPGVSKLLDLYVNGRDIKSTVNEQDEDGLGFMDKTTIISDIASILGLDTVSTVTGLISDIDDIKSTIGKKKGGNEISTLKGAAEDIIDVAKEII